MAVTFVLADGAGERIDVGTSPLAELTALLHALADPHHHLNSSPLLARARLALAPRVSAELAALSPLWSGYRSRLLFPAGGGLGRSLEEELTLLDSYPDEAFFECSAWAIRGGYSGCPPLAELRAPSGAEELLNRARARSAVAHALMRSLLEDAAALRRRLVSLLEECDGLFFATEWKTLGQRLEADANARTALLQRAGPVAVLASLTRAAEVLAAPAGVRFEKVHHGRVEVAGRGLLLVPSLAGWPHVLVKHEPGWRPLVQFPVQDVAAGPPSVAEVRRRLDALTEPTRLRLCRLVAQSPATTTDLAARTGMSAPQVSRHLRVLREAGLIERSRDGRHVHYQVCQDEIARLGVDLLTALLR